MKMTLFERFHVRVLERFADGVRDGRVTFRGVNVWTGNLSMRRAAYLETGGFDFSLGHSEDAEARCAPREERRALPRERRGV